MKINKGDLLKIKSSRKGTYTAIATKDFDTETDEWYSVALADKNKAIVGMNPDNLWIAGDEVPCRRGLCEVELLTPTH